MRNDPGLGIISRVGGAVRSLAPASQQVGRIQNFARTVGRTSSEHPAASGAADRRESGVTTFRVVRAAPARRGPFFGSTRAASILPVRLPRGSRKAAARWHAEWSVAKTTRPPRQCLTAASACRRSRSTSRCSACSRKNFASARSTSCGRSSSTSRSRRSM
jgi:hypothetical protein